MPHQWINKDFLANENVTWLLILMAGALSTHFKAIKYTLPTLTLGAGNNTYLFC